MKNLQKHTYSKSAAISQLAEYSNLLAQKPTLSERRDILPFFKRSPDLNLLISYHLPKMRQADCYASEFDIYSDFKADMIVGDSKNHQYLLIEFEDGRPDSIFRSKGNKATPDWSPRFESAHSQLMDWLWKIEDMRGTGDFLNTFGSRRAKFSGIIITGKNMNLSNQELDRLEWRTSKTIVESTHVMCVSFDELLENFQHYISIYK
ncbi:Shedu immune nuclease family protein [Enterobacter hormaechei]|uniref:Shedu immune nuclease family protein n=1 Tax=Enterobacteriaceae TaxID=543 RepID=UPI001AE28859|nr:MULTISPECIES: Shedu immune nuclease family protein [Enterobacteriaceae]HDT6029022.1 DUF4263 domain-containing protein [Enterobacter cloacae subsp. cloacae]EKS6507029.1 DUF4263 domain-containing protein [Enterobacter hormaechei]ELE6477998.1 DUF4263 domain-containing protein [Enterobacter hormaechei]ELT6450931.1 DUF4263 domain-containing protein [Enterobacter hormaechei]EMF0738307.1 DUF4263 domain-containing protein [Enterobacter hormaechei]